MKKLLAITLLILFALGAFYYYKYAENQQNVSLESLVPHDAVMFYSSDDFINDIENIDSSSLGNFLFSFDALKLRKKQFNSIATLIPDDKISINISAHKIAKKDFDLIYYFDENQDNIKELVDILAKKNKWKSEERRLDKIRIKEFYQDKKSVLNYCEIANWLILSKNPFLIEELIKDKESFEYLERNKITLFPVQLNSLLSDFLIDKSSNKFFNLNDSPIVFDLINYESEVRLSGISTVFNEKEILFKDFNFENYIPMSSFLVQKKRESIQVQNIDGSLIEILKVNPKIIYSDTLYAGYKEFPLRKEKAYWYCKFTDQNEIKGSSKDILSDYLVAIENDNVWGKSLKMRDRLKETIFGANNSTFINFDVSSFKNFLNNDTKKTLGSSINNFNKLDFLSFQNENDVDKSLYEWGITFNEDVKLATNQVDEIVELKNKLIYTHSSNFILKPYLVRNHLNSKREIISQDSLLNLCLINTKGKLLWSKQLGVKIISDINQVDLFRNGKLQYAFASKNLFHVVDRNGEDVEGFPITLEENVQFLSVFDYDKDKRYRFLLSTVSGNYYLLDSKGENLDPWNPLKLASKALRAPQHMRIGNKDVIVLVTENNKVHVLNRRGEYLKGFPFMPNITSISNFRCKKGDKLKSSEIELFSVLGKSQTVNLIGEVVTSKKYTSDLIGDFIYSTDGKYLEYYIVGDYSSKIYSSEGKELKEIFSKVNKLQYYHFNNDYKVNFSSNKKSTSLIINEVDKGSFNSSQNVRSIYSSANNELKIYNIYNNEISIIEVGN